MLLQIEQNGARRTVTSTELFQLAASGAIFPKTRLWVDGKETTCDNVQGIYFGPARQSASSACAPSPSSTPRPSCPNVTEQRPTSDSDPRVVHTQFVDYYIGGGALAYVLCYLHSGQTIVSPAGGRVWMKGAISTQNQAQGGFLKSLGRLAAGETLFMSSYAASGESEIAFATKMPGAIVARQLAQGESIVCQRGSFLAATPGVSLDIFFQKRSMTGFFGGEGFVMQKITGPGVVFLEVDGSPVEYVLQPGERMICDTGALAWMDATCSIEVKTVSGLKNILLGGEGVFETTIVGPGRVTFQSMSLTQTAGVLAPLIAKLLPHNN